MTMHKAGGQLQCNSSEDPAVRRVTRSFAAALTLKHSLLFVTLWCFAWGTVSLTLRATLLTPRRALLWGATGIVGAVIAAAILARRQLPAPTAVRALLDERNRCGGLLMAADDAEIGQWPMPEVATPRLRFRNPRAWGLFAVSVVFALVSLLAPVRFSSMNAARPMDVNREAEALAARIDTLKEAELLDSAKAEELAQRLEQLAAEASGEDPARTWEALDHLADAVEKTARDAAETTAARQEGLEQAAALAEGLMAGSDQLDARTMTEAMQTLSAMMQRAMQEDQMLASDLSPETQAALRNGALPPDQLGEAADALRKRRAANEQRLAKAGKAGAIPPGALKGGARSGPRDNSGLAKYLKENARKQSIDELVSGWCENPGKTGVSRGRGDAAMTWSDGTSEKEAKFKEQALPPSSVAGLDESRLVGMSASAPTIDRTGAASHTVLGNAATGGGSAHTQTILPRHKGAVKRYFERPPSRR
ncbi:MAG: hypothetical protein SF339_20345 [Blastocatellia bacterium]|nr:hypothetical protein [Blastocatellia bacterium]